MSNTTKKQHYVWRKYLVPWTDNGLLESGKVFVFRKAPKGAQALVECRELMKIAFENYFYDISGFGPKDVNVYRQFIEHFQKNQTIKMDINPDILSESNIQKDFIEKEVMCSTESIDGEYQFLDKLYAHDFSFYKDSISQEAINTLRKVMLESILIQEQTLSDDKLIEIANRGFQNINEPDLKYEFNHFFSMQYFRSPKIHKALAASFEEFKQFSKTLSDLKTDFYVNLIAIFFAQTMALNLTQKLHTSLLLFDNQSSIPFITGDTPIVNISDKEDITVFHYPISPTTAVNMIVSPIKLENGMMKVDESLKGIVDNLNRKLFNNCFNEVYANNQSAFDAYNLNP